MPVALEARTARQATIDQRRMVQAVFQHGIAGCEQGGKHAGVGHPAGGKQQGARTLREFRECFFKRVMRARVAGDQVRSAAACAVFIGAVPERRDHRRVIGEAQVVVAAEIEEAAIIKDDFRADR